MNKTICIRTLQTPLGPMTAAAGEDALTGLWFVGQKYYPSGTDTWTQADLPIFGTLENWLKGYFSGQNPGLLPALGPRGTAFQREVWRLLLEIPYGETTTYGALAQKLAAARNAAGFSAQAAGGAVGRNPISILIPCHRVLGSDGSLTGYAGGLEKKEALLQLERSAGKGTRPTPSF